MSRIVALIVVAMATHASAQATRPTLWGKSPTTRPAPAPTAATAPTTTQPADAPLTVKRDRPAATQGLGLIGADPDPYRQELTQAVELMLAKKFLEAGRMFDQMFKELGAENRTRPMVLNRAIVDVTNKRMAVRAVKELGEYLTKNRAEDELATNILAAALNIAAEDSAVKKGKLWQDAYTEWERRNYVLDRSRPGYRRWGAQWMTEKEFEELKAKQKEYDDSIAAAEDRLAKAEWRGGATRMQADADAEQIRMLQN